MVHEWKNLPRGGDKKKNVSCSGELNKQPVVIVDTFFLDKLKHFHLGMSLFEPVEYGSGDRTVEVLNGG